jgi:lysophospholipase L1-like esterase
MLGFCGTATGAQPWHWVTTWGAAQQVPEPQNELPAVAWKDGSLRQIVRTTLGGKVLRVRVSNVHGTAPLVVDGASIARALKPGTPDVDPATLRQLTFGGRSSVVIPAGAEYYSDSVSLDHAAGADLAVSLYFKDAPARQTGHPGSRSTSFTLAGRQELVAKWPDAGKIARWYALTDIEVQAPGNVGALVTIGDSITDGYGVTPDTNSRWPDFLAVRMAKEGLHMGVVNTGIGGGRMLLDGLGPNMASRFERDVLGRSGVTHALVLIGVNDMGGLHRSGQDTPEARMQMLEDLKLAHRQLVERAHAHGVCVLGGTVLPYAGSDYYKPAAGNEEDRKALNQWIRSSGVFDAVVDFDAALRDPSAPDRLRKDIDNDGLHPSIAGYRELANAVPLTALRQCKISK